VLDRLRLVGVVGAVLVGSSLVFAPGRPVYLAILAGVATGSLGAAWTRR